MGVSLVAASLRSYRKRKRHGMVTVVYLLTYPLCRLLFENLRGTDRVMWGGLSSAQGIRIGLMTVGATLLVYILRKPAISTTA